MLTAARLPRQSLMLSSLYVKDHLARSMEGEMAEQPNIIAAFSADQVTKLTGLTKSQLAF